MGEVYRAHDSRLHRYVAVKCLSSEVTGDARALLLDEARAAAALNHPHICTIHEVADIDQQFFIVMELVDGRLLYRGRRGRPCNRGDDSLRHPDCRRRRTHTPRLRDRAARSETEVWWRRQNVKCTIYPTSGDWRIWGSFKTHNWPR